MGKIINSRVIWKSVNNNKLIKLKISVISAINILKFSAIKHHYAEKEGNHILIKPYKHLFSAIIIYIISAKVGLMKILEDLIEN